LISGERWLVLGDASLVVATAALQMSRMGFMGFEWHVYKLRALE
jgi:hypothetical protein